MSKKAQKPKTVSLRIAYEQLKRKLARVEAQLAEAQRHLLLWHVNPGGYVLGGTSVSVPDPPPTVREMQAIEKVLL